MEFTPGFIGFGDCLLTDEERATVASDGVDAPATGSQRQFDRFWYQRELLPAETWRYGSSGGTI